MTQLATVDIAEDFASPLEKQLAKQEANQEERRCNREEWERHGLSIVSLAAEVDPELAVGVARAIARREKEEHL